MARKPTLPKSASATDCVRYVMRLTRWIGPGFHPDTRFCEYTNDNGEHTFAEPLCTTLEAELVQVRQKLDAAGIDICAPSFAVQKRILLDALRRRPSGLDGHLRIERN
jgi:hypothetical protein